MLLRWLRTALLGIVYVGREAAGESGIGDSFLKAEPNCDAHERGTGKRPGVLGWAPMKMIHFLARRDHL